MKTQLSILLATMQANWFKLLAVISTFLMPISGLLFLVGFVIVLDTITGVWKSIKHKVPITSRGLSAIIGLDLWQAMKNLFARAKDIKKEVDEIRHDQDISGTPI